MIAANSNRFHTSISPEQTESGAMDTISSNLEATDDLVPSLQQVRRLIPFDKTGTAGSSTL